MHLLGILTWLFYVSLLYLICEHLCIKQDEEDSGIFLSSKLGFSMLHFYGSCVSFYTLNNI